MKKIEDLTLDDIERFESRIDKQEGGCWIWKAGKGGNGYGQFYYNGKQVWAHRLSYTLYVGPIPEGILVCHHCDCRNCVNFSHLFLGSHKDNSQDMVKKGRANKPKGNRYRSGKLHTEETKKKMSISRMGNTNMLGKTHTKEARKKMSNAKMGNTNAAGNTNMLGKFHSEKTKQKISKSHKARNHSK
jgi:hypothetical protein